VDFDREHRDVPRPIVEFDVDVDVDLDIDWDIDVSSWLDVLVDGLSVLVFGELTEDVPGGYRQGDNPFGFHGTCGLCCCASVLRRFGLDVSESDVVRHAVDNGLCVTGDDPRTAGGTTLEWQAQVLRDFGVPAHVDVADSLEELATCVEERRGAIINVNAGVLWNDAAYWDFGYANHAVTITAFDRDPDSGLITGFYVDDSGTGQTARRVDADTMTGAWLAAGGTMVTTDLAFAPPREASNDPVRQAPRRPR
jgi:hypothetical protein